MAGAALVFGLAGCSTTGDNSNSADDSATGHNGSRSSRDGTGDNETEYNSGTGDGGSDSGSNETDSDPQGDDDSGSQNEIGSASGSWQTYQYDTARSGYAPSETPPGDDASVQWTSEVGQTFAESSPAVSGETVVVTTYGGSVRGIDLATGTERWVYETSQDVYASPTVQNGTAFVGAADGKLHAIDTSTGEGRWTYTAGYPVNRSVAVSGDVYLAAQSGTNSAFVAALDPETGGERWRHSLDTYGEYGATVSGAVTVADESVVIGTGRYGSTFVCLDASTGDSVWTFDSSTYSGQSYDEVFHTAAVVDGSVFVPLTVEDPNNVSTIISFDLSTGDVRWEWQREGELVAGDCAVGPEAVYITTTSDDTAKLVRLNRQTHSVDWSVDLATSSPRCAPLLVDSTLFVGNSRFDPADGAHLGVVGESQSWAQRPITNGYLVQNHSSRRGSSYKMYSTDNI
ncbi:PQQ enzyme repeat domain protein [Salinarchaeum sp. Harcht-Bsk1]|nr:PQQ enzyme repeat domain protein [Salinarchaeum sp. Harcht-Bsk1]